MEGTEPVGGVGGADSETSSPIDEGAEFESFVLAGILNNAPLEIGISEILMKEVVNEANKEAGARG